MPVFLLDDTISFPDPEFANRDGLLAVGGELSTDRILEAYRCGIFPWYNHDSPILWWSPDPRMILIPDELKVSKSLAQIIRNKAFKARFDTAFPEVIIMCSGIERKNQDGTWITEEMIDAYIALHEAGYAHSVETYLEGKLVGGLYGISLGKAFFGESMFFTESNASKVALYALVEKLRSWDFHFIDAQQKTSHIKSMGANAVPRKKFIKLLEKALTFETHTGKWT